MLQRIQSLYLAIVVLLEILVSQFNLITFTKDDSKFELSVFGLFNAEGTTMQEDQKQLVLVVLAIVMSILSIVMFKNRTMQIKIVNFTKIIILTQAAFVVLSLYFMNQNLATNMYPSFSAYFIVVSSILVLKASKAIKKDEELVKSVDRIR